MSLKYSESTFCGLQYSETSSGSGAMALHEHMSQTALDVLRTPRFCPDLHALDQDLSLPDPERTAGADATRHASGPVTSPHSDGDSKSRVVSAGHVWAGKSSIREMLEEEFSSNYVWDPQPGKYGVSEVPRAFEYSQPTPARQVPFRKRSIYEDYVSHEVESTIVNKIREYEQQAVDVGAAITLRKTPNDQGGAFEPSDLEARAKEACLISKLQGMSLGRSIDDVDTSHPPKTIKSTPACSSKLHQIKSSEAGGDTSQFNGIGSWACETELLFSIGTQLSVQTLPANNTSTAQSPGSRCDISELPPVKMCAGEAYQQGQSQKQSSFGSCGGQGSQTTRCGALGGGLPNARNPEGVGDGDDGDDDDDDPRTPLASVDSQKEAATTLRLACPFHQYDPHYFSINSANKKLYRLCGSDGFEDMARLEEHLYRRHLYAFFCENCLVGFENQHELRNHRRTSCVHNTRGDLLGITPEMKQTIQADRKRNVPLMDRWNALYRFLFQGTDVPSPYFSGIATNDDGGGSKQHCSPPSPQNGSREEIMSVIMRLLSHQSSKDDTVEIIHQIIQEEQANALLEASIDQAIIDALAEDSASSLERTIQASDSTSCLNTQTHHPDAANVLQFPPLAWHDLNCGPVLCHNPGSEQFLSDNQLAQPMSTNPSSSDPGYNSNPAYQLSSSLAGFETQGNVQALETSRPDLNQTRESNEDLRMSYNDFLSNPADPESENFNYWYKY